MPTHATVTLNKTVAFRGGTQVMQKQQYVKYSHATQKYKEKKEQLFCCSGNQWLFSQTLKWLIAHIQYIVIGEIKGKGCSSTAAGVRIITHFFPPAWEYSSSNTAPISPTAVLLVMLLVSWPGRQNDEVGREVITVCSSDDFPDSHLILATAHQRGKGERVCAAGRGTSGAGRGEVRSEEEGGERRGRNQR